MMVIPQQSNYQKSPDIHVYIAAVKAIKRVLLIYYYMTISVLVSLLVGG
jgi:hypothetical protein